MKVKSIDNRRDRGSGIRGENVDVEDLVSVSNGISYAVETADK